MSGNHPKNEDTSTDTENTLPDAPVTRSGPLGDYSFAFGVGALLALMLPAFSDYVSLALALAALAIGFVGIRQYEKGVSQKIWITVVGMLLAAVAIFIDVLMWTAS